jgi:hypothetical protein
MSGQQKTPEPQSPGAGDRAPTFWQVVRSVGASFFGVQNSANRRRDFTHGRPLPFILVGLAMTALLVLAVIVAVRLALSSAGM